MQNKKLSNGYSMPLLIQGVPLLRDYASQTKEQFSEVIKLSIGSGVYAFDTSHDYGKSEAYLGYAVNKCIREKVTTREEIFITSKLGNSQQVEGKIETYVDNCLRTMKLDYLDCMLLHWPYPDYYVENWKKLEKVYESGKIKTIGIANICERHLNKLIKSDINIVPHIAQFEYHPFRTVPELIEMCNSYNIGIQAYTSLVQMIPLVTQNTLLRELADKYKRTIPQIIMRWDVQHGIAPIFRTYNAKHLLETTDIYNFELSELDMVRISSLNQDYKLHPESMNCPGF